MVPKSRRLGKTVGWQQVAFCNKAEGTAQKPHPQHPAPGPPSLGWGVPLGYLLKLAFSKLQLSVPKAERGEKPTTQPPLHPFCWTWLLSELDGGTPEIPGE